MSDDIDDRLRLLLAERGAPPPDPHFVDRVIALAAFDLKTRRGRRSAFAQVGREVAALAAVIASFFLLARGGPEAGFGDAIALGSPAFLGMAMLLLWTLVAGRGPVALSR